MARVYATRADLLAYAAQYGTDYAVPAEPQATGLLTLASARVEGMVTEPYDTDSATLLPTDAEVTAALRDATCAQVLRQLGKVGEDDYTTVSVGSVTLTKSATGKASTRGELDPDPLVHLAAARLVGSGVVVL